MLPLLATTVIPALIPAAIDGFRSLIGLFTGGKTAPLTAEQRIQLMQADIERLKALAQLDQAGDVHKWVNDVRALQRPAAVVIVLITWLAVHFIQVDESVRVFTAELASSVIFYLFGDRTNTYLKRAK